MVEALHEDGSDVDKSVDEGSEILGRHQVLTLPNSPNWDYEAPASFLESSKTLAFCANSNVHIMQLTDDGFTHQQTVGFSAKFKKQYCRCVTVLLLN